MRLTTSASAQGDQPRRSVGLADAELGSELREPSTPPLPAGGEKLTEEDGALSLTKLAAEMPATPRPPSRTARRRICRPLMTTSKQPSMRAGVVEVMIRVARRSSD
ncbi:MAG: Uncharacterised protein [Synechococcus sp. MIT S9220]|nr:MAG: Uncharacterised protein [Synechococcus sp. MIT S9220]